MMSRKLVTVLLVFGVLLCLTVSPALAAPPLPTTPSNPPVVPAAPPVPPSGQPIYHVVQWRETLTRIAAYYGTTVWAIAQANGITNVNYIRIGQVLLIPVVAQGPLPSPHTYIVQPGDTLSAIAWRFGTTVWAIAQANGIWNPNYIYVGQTLYLP
jgi:putative chitinase